MIDTNGFDLIIEDSVLSLNPNPSSMATLRIYALQTNGSETSPSVTLKNSVLRFSLIYMEVSQSIVVDVNSSLDANGTGQVLGPGHYEGVSGKISGGSFGGQGGNCDNVFIDKTYSWYNRYFPAIRKD